MTEHPQHDDPVVRELAALADDDAARSASPHVERAVIEAFVVQRRRRWLVPVAAAAGLLVALSAGYLALQRTRPVPSVPPAPLAQDEFDAGIVQWARLQVPREYLPQLGIAMVEPGAGPTVIVEVAIGEDGKSHAVRLVQ